MKRILFPLLAVLALPILNTGCTTLTEPQAESLNRTSRFVEGLAYDAGRLALSLKPENRQHVEQAVTAIDQLLLSEVYDPSAVKEALRPVFAKIKDPWVELACNQAVNAYDLAVGQFVKGEIAKSPVAHDLLAALRDGGKRALNPGGADTMSVPRGNLAALIDLAEHRSGKTPVANRLREQLCGPG